MPVAPAWNLESDRPCLRHECESSDVPLCAFVEALGEVSGDNAPVDPVPQTGDVLPLAEEVLPPTPTLFVSYEDRRVQSLSDVSVSRRLTQVLVSEAVWRHR